MNRLWHSIRTPAFVVAVLALAAALFGTAIAASPQASQSASAQKTAQKALKKANQALSIASTTSKEKGPKGDTGSQGVPGSPGSPGSPGISGYEIVREESASNSNDSKEISPECPPGKKVIGGGALAIGPGFEDVALDASVLEEENGWFASAHEHTATVESWALEVEMVCANVN